MFHMSVILCLMKTFRCNHCMPCKTHTNKIKLKTYAKLGPCLSQLKVTSLFLILHNWLLNNMNILSLSPLPLCSPLANSRVHVVPSAWTDALGSDGTFLEWTVPTQLVFTFTNFAFS